MILPSKHISQEQSLLGVGAFLLTKVGRRQTVTNLWEKVREEHVVGTFERFVLALVMLHIAGAIEFVDGLIVEAKR